MVPEREPLIALVASRDLLELTAVSLDPVLRLHPHLPRDLVIRFSRLRDLQHEPRVRCSPERRATRAHRTSGPSNAPRPPRPAPRGSAQCEAVHRPRCCRRRAHHQPSRAWCLPSSRDHPPRARPLPRPQGPNDRRGAASERTPPIGGRERAPSAVVNLSLCVLVGPQSVEEGSCLLGIEMLVEDRQQDVFFLLEMQ